MVQSMSSDDQGSKIRPHWDFSRELGRTFSLFKKKNGNLGGFLKKKIIKKKKVVFKKIQNIYKYRPKYQSRPTTNICFFFKKNRNRPRSRPNFFSLADTYRISAFKKSRFKPLVMIASPRWGHHGTPTKEDASESTSYLIMVGWWIYA